MENPKLEKLLRYHRQNVFDNDIAKADRHERALKRLKKTQSYKDMCKARREYSDSLKSDRFLYMYA